MPPSVIPRAALLEEVELASLRGIVEAAAPELARRLGLRHAAIGGAGAILTTAVDVPLFNRALGVGVLEPAEPGAIDRVTTLWAGTGVHHLVQVVPEAETPELRAALEARGLRRVDAWAKLWRGAEPAPEVPTDLRVEEVGPERAEALGHILATAFGMPDELLALFDGILGRPGWRTYMAFDGEEPVATGTLFEHGEVGALLAGATLASHRRRGAQGAIMARRIRDGLADGCRLFVSEAAEDTPEEPNPSYHNMLRTGFRLAYLRANYLGGG